MNFSTKIWARLLYGSFAVIFCIAMLPNYSKAQTVNELRQSVGMAPEIIAVSIEDEVVDQGEEDVDREIIQISTDEQNKLSSMLENLEVAKKGVEQGFIGNAGPLTILGMAAKVAELENSIETQRKLADAEQRNNLTTEALNGAYDFYDEAEYKNNGVFGEINFDIGGIGDATIYPIDGTVSIVRPYGYKYENGQIVGNKNIDMLLLAYEGQSIMSMFNGQVTSVSLADGLTEIVVYHGTSFKTIYRGLDPKSVDLFVGRELTAGDSVGKAGSNGFISIEAWVKEGPINPILLFGGRGEQMYNQYCLKNTDVYVVNEGEKYFWNEDMQAQFEYTEGSTLTPPDNGFHSELNSADNNNG